MGFDSITVLAAVSPEKYDGTGAPVIYVTCEGGSPSFLHWAGGEAMVQDQYYAVAGLGGVGQSADYYSAVKIMAPKPVAAYKAIGADNQAILRGQPGSLIEDPDMVGGSGRLTGRPFMHYYDPSFGDVPPISASQTLLTWMMDERNANCLNFLDKNHAGQNFPGCVPGVRFGAPGHILRTVPFRHWSTSSGETGPYTNQVYAYVIEAPQVFPIPPYIGIPPLHQPGIEWRVRNLLNGSIVGAGSISQVDFELLGFGTQFPAVIFLTPAAGTGGNYLQVQISGNGAWPPDDAVRTGSYPPPIGGPIGNPFT